MNDMIKLKNLLKTRPNYLYYLIGIILIISMSQFLPFRRIKSNERADNPQGSPYYITLLSIVSNYSLLDSDHANLKLIKNKLLQFEKEMKESTDPVEIISNYRQSYHNALSTFGLTSIKDASNDNTIVDIARKAAGTVDNYYLDSRLFSINPLYFPKGSHSRRILQYNLGGLYDNAFNKYSRIVVAFPNDSQLGIFSGYFVNNQTTTLETQFMTGMPLLTALYVLPKYNYEHLGSYEATVPWGYFRATSFIDKTTRKVLDIAGIDIFSVLQSELTEKKIKKIPGAIPFGTSINPMFGGDARSYINTQSYGTAYLANQTYYINASDIKPYEETIRNYFSHPINHDVSEFTNATNFFYQKLINLKQNHDIILEGLPKKPLVDHVVKPAGSVIVEGIVGPRAFFNANCLRNNCDFVFNMSDAPGWHAFVNGKYSKISRANFAFMQVPVSAGQSNVWFIYEPLSSLVSYLISILSLIGFFMLCNYRVISNTEQS